MTSSDLLILGIISGGFLFYYLRKAINKLKIKRIIKRAKNAEQNAISFLKKEGYKIIDLQRKKDIITYIDDKPYHSYIQVDLIVKKGRKKYVVEVKTGNKTRATNAQVRRQLLEYYLVFKPDGILLLDMDKGTLKRVEFECRNYNYSWLGVILSAVAGLITGFILWGYMY